MSKHEQNRGDGKDIPVEYEPKTFAQHRRTMLINLESNNSGGQQMENFWKNEVGRWVSSAWENWDEEMRRMQRSMFSLLPLDQFGLNKWEGSSALADPHGLINQMEHEVHETRNRMGFTDAPLTGALADYMRDAYELGDDSRLHFKVRFNVRGFSPEDIKVNTTEGRLTVHAKKVSEKNNSRSTREFCRMIYLPERIQLNDLQCQLTEDGVLMVQAPVTSLDYQSLAFNDKNQLCIRPRAPNDLQRSPGQTNALTVRGVSGPTVFDDDTNGKRIHIEVPLDPIYKSDDLSVNVDSSRVLIRGFSQTTCGGHSSMTTEFSHSYVIPETIDPLTVEAQVVDHTLVLEAPLRKQCNIQCSN